MNLLVLEQQMKRVLDKSKEIRQYDDSRICMAIEYADNAMLF